jgi:multicomponent Na+:H+ antiporter subunit B
VTPAGRRIVYALGALGVGVLLAWGFAGLPDFGHYPGPYGDVLNAAAGAERHVTNVPTSVVFDYRGFDTLGEEMILFGAALGVALLLRAVPLDEAPPAEEGIEDDELRLLGLLLAPPTLLLALYLVAFGHLTPGGGFQGGVVVLTAFVLLYLGVGTREFGALAPHLPVSASEGTGAGGFVVVGLVGLVVGGAFLENVLPLGTLKSLAAGGTIPLLNVAAALAVGAGLLLIVRELLEEYVIERGRDDA